MIITGLLERLLSGNKTRQLFMYAAAPVSIAVGRLFLRMETRLPFLFIFGITTADFISYDYYPILPWIGVFFAGYAAGLFVINNRDKLASIHAGGRYLKTAVTPLCALGRVSLPYYLLHQPALLAVFFVFNFLRGIAFNL